MQKKIQYKNVRKLQLENNIKTKTKITSRTKIALITADRPGRNPEMIYVNFILQIKLSLST